MDFQSEKSFGKLRLRAFQPYHHTLCMLKHVKDVEDNLRHLRHASTYIGCDGMVRAFQPYHHTLCMLKHVEDVEDYL